MNSPVQAEQTPAGNEAADSATTQTISRQRVEAALAHTEADRVPLDLGGTTVTGMQASTVHRLRQALHLDSPGTPVKVIEPFQMLGEVAPDLAEALGVDVVGLSLPTNFFGFKNEDWKPWALFDGTPVLVPGKFNTTQDPKSGLFMYPEGDTSAAPSARMPKGGFYFDSIIRQEPIDDEHLDPEGNVEGFGLLSEEDLTFVKSEAERLYATGKAVVGNFWGMNLGDIAFVPGPSLKRPKGIRDVEEWYASLSLRPDYVRDVFERQSEVGMTNLRRLYEAAGDKVTVVTVTGADFGGQQGPLISPKMYRALFKPFHVQVNEWIHANTGWRSFIHSCGSIWRLLDDIVDAGFDVLNPVQTSAAEMAPEPLKQRYGERVT
jgi:Uroporphyrinogen decarboxylase (URO-D)